MKLCISELLLLVLNVLLVCKDTISQEFRGVCGGSQTARRGTLISPNYPSHYPVNNLCVWVLNTNNPYGKVRLTFATFELEPESSCKYDYVLVRDGSSPSSHMIGKFCGSSKPATITSSGRSLWVEFRSDSSDRRPGFLARWETEFAFPHETETPFTSNPYTTQVVPLACGGNIYGTHGIITSPNFPEKYPNNKKCKWTIIAPIGSKVQLNFDSFHIENDRSCRYDYLEIRDGGDSGAPFIDKLCGRTYPGLTTSSGHLLHLEFNSDGTESASGFRIEWHALGVSTPAPLTTTVQTTQQATTSNGACDLTLRGSGGIIKSPNYPNDYPINKMCTWTIKVEREEEVELEFQTVDLERDATCQYDYIEVRDGSNVQAALKERFCGNTVPQLIKSTNDALHVEFFSDASDTKSGFYATWRAVDKRGYFETTRSSVVITNPPTVTQGCGGTLSSQTGSLESPRYPQNYPSNIICQWRIQVPNGYKIHLEFSRFDVEADTRCRFDYLVVYDGPSVASPQLRKICGNEQSSIIPTLDSSSNVLTIVFNSDMSVTAGGFLAHWNSNVDGRIPPTTSRRLTAPPFTPPTGCGGTFVQPSGDIISPGYPYYYPNNVDCVWVVGVPDNKQIALGFEEFELEGGVGCRFDFVEVRDGDSQYSPLLGRYCGNTAPLMMKGSSDKLWLRFHTNGFVTGRGFEATWTTEAQFVKPIQGGIDIIQRDTRQPSPPRKCGHPLGLESKEIRDSQLTASSSWMSGQRYGPQQARLNNKDWPQGWVADSRDTTPWLKIKLDGRHIVTGISTQGYGNQLSNKCVKSYQVSWYDRKHQGYVNYREQGKDKIFNGNTDRDTIVRHTFKIPINAEEILIQPKTWQGGVGLRVELYGCPLSDCIEPIGLANGAIKDNQLKASSAWNHEPSKYGAHRARLNITSWPQGWTANEQDHSPWLQVNLQEDFIVTQVATQGFGGALRQWVKSYKLAFMDDKRNWRDYYVPRTVGESEWRIKRFHANNDRTSITRHVLKVPIRSKVIRFWLQERHGAVSMRAELYGCSIARKQNGETRCSKIGNRLVGQSRLGSLNHCVWQLTSESAQGNFHLSVDIFRFENSDPTCTHDYLEVRNGYTQYAPIIGKYCGRNKPHSIRSTNGALWLKFVVSGETRNKVAMTYEFFPTHQVNHK